MIEGKLALHQRLGIQVGVAVAVLVAVAFTAASGFVVRRERDTLTREFTLRLLAETRSLAVATSGPLLRLDPELELHPLIQRALSETPDLVDLVVLDSQGRIQGHRELYRVGALYEPGRRGIPIELTGARAGEAARSERGFIVVEQSIRHLGQPIGLLVARASSHSVEQAVRESRRHLAVVGTLVTVLTILSAFGFVRLGLRSLDELQRGVLDLGSGDLRARVHVRSRNELGLFGELLNRMADGLQRAQTDLVHKERLDREIEIAHELQSMLLPRGSVAVPGYDLESRYISALEVGGDYYDIVPLGGERLFLVTADVSGKGIPGLVVMSMLRTALHARAHPGMLLPDVLVAANAMLRSTVKRGMFVTCHVGILDLRSGIYRYVSAGHCPPIRFGDGRSEVLPAGGKPLGFFPDSVLSRSLVERSTCLEQGDGLILYTDGLVESMDAAGQPLGIELVLERLRSSHAPSGPRTGRAEAPIPDAARLVDELIALVNAHRGDQRPSDDLTMTVVRREPSRAAAGVGGRA